MAEKDATARLRRAVKENNLFLVKRLIQRTDMRNTDTASQRYTSLAWAAVLGHEETFDFLLTQGHDDEELSRDSENNTILMLLAEQKAGASNSHNLQDNTGAFVRMARLYFDRYSWILDWSNVHGKTALHIASLKGNEELVRMLCDLGADFDLADNKGNTSLHYASSWGHIATVQLLIERGCQYSARNNQGFTASDYAYSFSTRETLQDTARAQFENNKKQRRNIFAQAAQTAAKQDWTSSSLPPPPVPTKDSAYSRMRSGSGTSRTTATSDSGDPESLRAGQLSPSPSQPSTGSSSAFLTPSNSQHYPQGPASSNAAVFPAGSGHLKGSLLTPTANNSNPTTIVNRLRERDADAIEKYLNRNRSGSQGTASTDARSQGSSQFASAGPSANGDDLSALISGSVTPRKLRPSVSAAQLRTGNNSTPVHSSTDVRNRSDTSPPLTKTTNSPHASLTRTSSTSRPSIAKTLRSIASMDRLKSSDKPESAASHSFLHDHSPHHGQNGTHEDPATPPANTRRKAFHILSKPLHSFELTSSSSHRRGMSSTSVRGS